MPRLSHPLMDEAPVLPHRITQERIMSIFQTDGVCDSKGVPIAYQPKAERRTSTQKAIYVDFNTNSNSPRAKRWYKIQIAGLVDGHFYPIGHLTLKNPITNRRDAMTRARAAARDRGWTLLEGLWRPAANNVLEQVR